MPDRAATDSDHPTADLSKIRERVTKVEWQQEAFGKRLGEGAETFSELRASIAEVRTDIKEAHDKFREAIAPKPLPTWKIASFLFGVVCVAAGLIWTFARYPDRDEFNNARQDQAEQTKAVERELERVKDRQAEIRTDQKLIKDSVQRQEKQQDKIDDKLDRLLNQPVAPRVR